MKIWFVVLLLCSTLGSANAGNLPEGLVTSQRNQEAVLKYLRPALMSRGGAGRIYYSTACTRDGEPLPFPRVKVQAPSKGKIGLDAVRAIFGNDKHVAVSEDRSGMIRVTIGKPMSALLQTRIHSVTLKEDEQYNAQLAIFAILNSKEVEAAMRQLGFALDEPTTVFAGGINVSEKGVPLPHLHASIRDMTMDQALDLVARTFQGIVIYETCAARSGKRLVSLDFVQVGVGRIASGKGFVTMRIAESLQKRGIKLAVISVDGWLNLPHVRFQQQDLAKHFYENAIRFDEMFEHVILPLRRTRSVNVESDFTEETATAFRKHRYAFRNVDIILLEGIFLFKPMYRDHFDLKIWIDCSFGTALRRAMARGQEGLPPQEAKRAFETIYFPAQRIHLARDNPRKPADIVFANERL